MKTISVIEIVCLMFFCEISSAAKIEFAQWLPWKIVQEEISHAASIPKLSEQNIQLHWQDWKPEVSSVELDLSSAKFNFSISQSGVIAKLSPGQGIPISLKVGSFHLDQTVVREFGGNQISIRIKASCEPFEIQVRDYNIQVNAPFVRENNYIVPVAQNVAIQFRERPQLPKLNCSGPMGIDDRISQLINSSFADPSTIENLLTDYINKGLKNKITEDWKNYIKKSFPDLSITSASDPMELGFFLKVSIDTLVGDANEVVSLPNNLLIQPNLLPEIPKTLIPKESVSRYIVLRLNELKINNYNLQQLPSFAKFMKNRFAQFFIWSDLLHYSRKAPFNLNVQAITSSDVHASSGDDWNLKLQCLGNIVSERKGKNWNFIEWSMGLASKLTPSLVGDKLEIKSTNQISSMNWRYGAEYQTRFSPGDPAAKILRNAIESAVSNQIFSLQLPTLMSSFKVWKIEKINFENEILWADWTSN